jgi:hypothetical protein
MPAEFRPVDFGTLTDLMEKDPDVTVVRRLPAPDVALFSAGPGGGPGEVVVAQMSASTAEQLNGHPQLLVEEDHLIRLCPGPGPAVTPAATSFLPSGGASTTWDLRVTRADDGTPLTGVQVYLYGSGYPAQGTTDEQGQVSLSLANETDSTLHALYVDAETDCWNLWVNRPGLTSGSLNTVRLRPLGESFPGLPGNQALGWGQRLMRLDQVPSRFMGQGAKVAVIDSGAAAKTHRDLSAVAGGTDLTSSPPSADSWAQDTVGHGSHCTGIIAGADNDYGIRGFAPEAQVLEIKIFPGGRFSDLLDALDFCIEQQVDVVNMSLGSGERSDLLLQKISQARKAGVACIVAAGNSGDAVQFPGTSPDVLTVAAMGKVGEYPDDSFHAQQEWVVQGKSKRQGDFFSARFSCSGPQVDLCAPGVAVLSSVPAQGFGAWDGTSMATPHVAGLAALVVAHHPDMSGPFRARDERRVARLFEILASSCTPMDFGDPTRSGAGVPDALRALGLDGPPSATSPSDDLLRQILAEIVQRMAVPPPPTPPVDPTSAGLQQLHDRLVAAGLLRT